MEFIRFSLCAPYGDFWATSRLPQVFAGCPIGGGAKENLRVSLSFRWVAQWGTSRKPGNTLRFSLGAPEVDPRRPCGFP